MQAAPIDKLRTGSLDLGNDRRIVLLASVDAFVQDRLDARLGEVGHGGIGETFAVSGLVMKDRDLLAFHGGLDIFSRHHALLVVTPAGAEHVPLALFRQGRVGGRGRDHQYVVFDVNV